MMISIIPQVLELTTTKVGFFATKYQPKLKKVNSFNKNILQEIIVFSALQFNFVFCFSVTDD